ncbi:MULTISPECIES: restriction endonuclease subunit S [Providencia]|uniref:restriction endonuclease subunit S n=1 Tax=Providencia TaxID=586 RepID=UPI00234AA2C4|nr:MULTISPECIES: restriction endonuclease subunit S [unclassified Providencia]
MSEVQYLPLTAVTTLVTDGKHGDCKNEENSGYYFLSSKDLRDGRLHYDNPRQINFKEFAETHRRTNLEVGDILLANTGASIGRVGIAQADNRIPNTTFQKSISVIKADKSIIDNRYLYYFFKDNSDLLSRLGGGAAQPNLLLGDIRKIQVRVPEKNTQIKIANILSQYDNLIENNNRRIAILEDMAQSLYREWFINFRYPNHENNLDTNGNLKLIDFPLGQIPEGWEVKCLKDIGLINTGKTPSKKKEENYSSRDVPFIKTPDMHSGMFVLNTKEMLSTLGADSQKNKYIPSWSICVSCIGTAGIVALSSQRSQTNQQINTLVPDSKKYIEFMYFALKSLKKTIENHGATGATMTNLSKGKFEALEIVFPNESMLNEFHNLANPMFKQIQNLSRKNENLKEQRDMLLSRLMSGAVEL